MLHWFPGHMHKARKELAKILPQIDVVFEVVEARAPEATANPLLHELASDKPIIKLLSKADLASPAVTKKWNQFYQNRSLALNTLKDKHTINKLTELARKSVPHRGTLLKPIRAVVVGIPNVGKSTLINALAGRKIAKTGNEPAITKTQQNIILSREFHLRDTPGIMSPSPKGEDASFRLAILGAIRDTAMDYPSAAYYLINTLKAKALTEFAKRYQLESNFILEETSEDRILTALSNTMGTLKAESSMNIHQTAEKFILDFRQGRIGRISLETPEDFLREQELEKSKTTEQ